MLEVRSFLGSILSMGTNLALRFRQQLICTQLPTDFSMILQVHRLLTIQHPLRIDLLTSGCLVATIQSPHAILGHILQCSPSRPIFHIECHLSR